MGGVGEALRRIVMMNPDRCDGTADEHAASFIHPASPRIARMRIVAVERGRGRCSEAGSL